MAIVDNIKRFKLNRDWTQGHLTDLVDVTRPTATQWEAGWSQPQMGATENSPLLTCPLPTWLTTGNTSPP